MTSDPGTTRLWKSRPFSSILLRLFVFSVPVVVGALSAVALSHALPDARGLVSGILWWLSLVVGALIPVVILQQLLRRLLPLAVLLRLTLLFPGDAPSRLKIARRAGRVRDLKKQLVAARREGTEDELTDAIEIILGLIAALGAHDRGTRGHSERVRMFTDLLAAELELRPDDRERLRWAALLHDVGKLTVSTEILHKPGRPAPEEWEIIERHPSEGLKIATPLIPWLGPWAGAIVHHHERFDGTGYPGGLSGDDISMAGRILAVTDSYETMTAARPYKKPMSAGAARSELTRCAGAQFDPQLVRAFLNISISRLWKTIGLAALLAQIPILAGVSAARIPEGVRKVSGSIATTAVLVAGLATVGAIDMKEAPPSASSDRRVASGSVPAGEGTPGGSKDDDEARSHGRGSGRKAPPPSPGSDAQVASPGDDQEHPQPGEQAADEPRDTPEPPAPERFRASGRITAFNPSSPSQDGVTRKEFLSSCGIPVSQGADAWIFELPRSIREGGTATLDAANELGIHQLTLVFYSQSCSLLGRAEQEGDVPTDTAFVVAEQSRGLDTLATLTVITD